MPLVFYVQLLKTPVLLLTLDTSLFPGTEWFFALETLDALDAMQSTNLFWYEEINYHEVAIRSDPEIIKLTDTEKTSSSQVVCFKGNVEPA